MLPKIGIGQLCGFLFLFILLTGALIKFMASTLLNPEKIPNAFGVGKIWLNLINPNVSMVSVLPLIPYEVVLGFWLLLRGGQLAAVRLTQYEFRPLSHGLIESGAC